MKKLTGACLVLFGFLAVAGRAAQVVPMAVSPGSERGVAVVGQVCPTFSWTAEDWASGYRVAVFEALGVQIPSYEEMAAGMVPALSKEIGGRALSWTPSAEEQLVAGSLYVWYVQAVDTSGQGSWSKGKLFIVEAGILASGTDGWLRKTLEEKGVREDVISDVLKEMKVEGPGVIAGRTDSRPQGKVGALGSEGPSNVLYGSSAGASITSGVYNTFIGLWAGALTTTGQNNNFLGYGAGYSNTTASANNFLGHTAGYSNAIGQDNNFFGYGAGFSNTSGNGNTFIGTSSGQYNTTGAYNVFVGYLAGRANTTASYNTFLGNYAGSFNTTGTSNTFLGYLAGYSNTTGSYNTILGYQAGYNTTASFDTFIGDYAGRNTTTGASNTFLGYIAGYSNTTGSSNTILGDYAGYSNTVGNNNLFLGNRAGYSETGSDKLYIANSSTSTPLVYGDFSSNIVGVNGWLGVGTQSPLYPMEVKTSGRNSVLVVQREAGALNFMNASSAYGQFGTGNGYPVRILVNSAWRMMLNLDNSLSMVNGASCTAGGVWTDASSRELKENIEGLSVAEAEEALRDLVPVKYNYKADKEERHVGFIAEDVPELVASKDRKTMSPMNVVGVLTKVAQEQAKVVQELDRMSKEQQKTILEQQKSLAEQQKTIADLKERVEELRKRGK